MSSRPSPMISRLLTLLALCLVATACGSASAQPSIDEVPDQLGTGERTLVENGEDPDGPLFGASVDEWLDESNLEAAAAAPASTPVPDGFQELHWEDLIPAGYGTDEILARFEADLAAVVPGSLEAEELYAEIQAVFDEDVVNSDVDGQAIYLAGFVAPLTYDGDLVTEFLLVPFFGACIHVPAPPANQTIIVTLAEGEGMTLDESWSAIWVAGTMTVSTTDTDIGTASYSILDAQFGLHNEF